MGLLILYVGIALGFSFLCSLLESCLLTITNAQLQAAKSKGKRWSGRLQKLKQNIDKPLAAILTLNTIAHTMGATGAGAQYAKVYGDATGGIFAGALTLAVLVFT
ncbi:MAG TPA: CNNM domain-containing protein, partial [Opitutales bacterium]|nr:CNNM domain-containing protein [Opitutales bacterium]